jgi:hypothetical protein
MVRVNPEYVRYWPIASFRCAADLGRHGSIADYARTCGWPTRVANDPNRPFVFAPVSVNLLQLGFLMEPSGLGLLLCSDTVID